MNTNFEKYTIINQIQNIIKDFDYTDLSDFLEYITIIEKIDIPDSDFNAKNILENIYKILDKLNLKDLNNILDSLDFEYDYEYDDNSNFDDNSNAETLKNSENISNLKDISNDENLKEMSNSELLWHFLGFSLNENRFFKSKNFNKKRVKLYNTVNGDKNVGKKTQSQWIQGKIKNRVKRRKFKLYLKRNPKLRRKMKQYSKEYSDVSVQGNAKFETGRYNTKGEVPEGKVIKHYRKI